MNNTICGHSSRKAWNMHNNTHTDTHLVGKNKKKNEDKHRRALQNFRLYLYSNYWVHIENEQCSTYIIFPLHAKRKNYMHTKAKCQMVKYLLWLHVDLNTQKVYVNGWP